MKARILKELGITEDQFYTKYPTQEAFENSEEGGAVLAKCGIKVKARKAFLGAIAGASGGAGGFMQNLTGGQGGAGLLSQLSGGNPLQKVSDIVAGFKAQKEAVNSANQNMQTMNWMEQAQASNSQNQQYDLQQARQKTYVRPEDNVLTGEELFPMYGVGTNVLAEQGARIKKSASSGKKAQAGMFLGSTGAQWGNLGKGMLGSVGKQATDAFNLAPDDMGGQIGSDVLGTIGAATGIPGLDMVGKIGGKFIGDLIDTSDNKIKKYNTAADRSLNNMIGMNMGAYNHKQFGANLENGGSIPSYSQGGNVRTYGEGGITPLSNNPYGGEMGMIYGPSHDDGGVDMNIYGENIEAEGGEPIMKMEEGGSLGEDSMVILGNLSPARHLVKSAEAFTGEKIKGNKYKTIGKNLGKIENNVTSKVDKINETLNPIPLRRLDIIENNSKKHMMDVYDTKLKKLQVIKEGFAKAQEAQNIESENAKYGKIIKAQPGTTKYNPGKNIKNILQEKMQSLQDPNLFNPIQDFIPSWQKSSEVINEEPSNQSIIGGGDPNRLTMTEQSDTKSTEKNYGDVAKPGFKHQSKTELGTYGGVNKQKYDDFVKRNSSWFDFSNFDVKKESDVLKLQQEYNKRTKGNKITEDGKFGDQTVSLMLGPNAGVVGRRATDEPILRKPIGIEITETPEKKESDGTMFDFMNLRGTDAEDFNSAQLLPEAWAMANNQLEPVQAQKFNPRLRTPYDISLQDQLNENLASTRSAERMAAHNPGALAALKAQQYLGNSGVLGNQFRMNQQFKDQVYSGNLNTLNEADLKNLATADLQYTRQAQAASKTKSTDFEAIKSMTDKKLKHNLENQTLRVWENMYAYRFDPSGRAQYRGPNADFSEWEGAGSEPINQVDYDYIKGPDGKLMRQKKTKSEPTKPSLANPSIVAMNGSIVKKIKKFK